MPEIVPPPVAVLFSFLRKGKRQYSGWTQYSSSHGKSSCSRKAFTSMNRLILTKCNSTFHLLFTYSIINYHTDLFNYHAGFQIFSLHTPLGRYGRSVNSCSCNSKLYRQKEKQRIKPRCFAKIYRVAKYNTRRVKKWHFWFLSVLSFSKEKYQTKVSRCAVRVHFPENQFPSRSAERRRPTFSQKS